MTAVLLEALPDVELSGYEGRSLTWVAAWETHMVATLAVLIRRAGQTTNCNHNCNEGAETIPS